MWEAIRDVKAREALKNISSIAEEFNKQDVPVTLERIDIHGSILRKEKAGDIDLVIRGEFKTEIKEEWKEFITTLNQNVFELYNLKSYERTTITELIEKHTNAIKAMGFKNRWIENWLPFVRMSDIYVAINRGMRHTSFDEGCIAPRFFNERCRNKRFQIFSTVIDRETGSMRTQEVAMSCITIWSREGGVHDISNMELETHFHQEAKELISTGRQLVNMNKFELQYIFSDAVTALKEDEEEIQKRFLEEFKFLNSNELSIVIDLRKSMLLRLENAFQMLKATLEVDETILNAEQLLKFNTELRELLRDIAILGIICELVFKGYQIGVKFSISVVEKVSEGEERKKAIFEAALPHMKNEGIKKRELKRVIERYL